MSGIRWLTSQEVVQLNAWVVKQTGEPHGIRSADLLESALGRPPNHHAYENVDDVLWLAVILLFAIAQNHPFSQGNKRTGFHAARAFLRWNGYDWLSDDAELGPMIILVIEGKLTERAFYELVAPDIHDLESIETRTRLAAVEAAVDKRAENIALFILADSQQYDMKAYLERGRRFKNETDARLNEIFAEELKAWATSTPPWTPPDRLDATQSELMLRSKDIPYTEEVLGYVDMLTDCIRKEMEMREGEPVRDDDIQRRIDKYWEQHRGQN